MTRGRVLFAVPYPGYLRYFDSVVHGLAERGYRVDFWVEKMSKQPEGLNAISGVDGVVVRGALPKRGGRFAKAALAERRAVDYIRYLDRNFARAAYLRERIGEKLPGWLCHLQRFPSLPHRLVMAAIRVMLVVERALPTAREFDDLIAETEPVLVVAAPVLTPASRLADLIVSAQAVNVPTVGAVASWDNFTTKGIFRVVPDCVLVWNELQVDEGVDLHLLPRERFAVTGAQPFDRWFERRPSRGREEFFSRVGLPADRPFVLFVGSTASISDPDAEIRFVLDWLSQMRSSEGDAFHDLGVMIRPHPYNSAHWPEVDLSAFGPAVLWPPAGANPVDESDRAEYFDSIHYASAIVGINTTAMIEAAIQRRPVLSVAASDFDATQSGTLHFRYLLPEHGGFVRVAQSLDEHFAQLRDALADPAAMRATIDAFVERFLRPNGIDRPCTPIVLDELERVIAAGSLPAPTDGPVARALGALALRTVFFNPGAPSRFRRRVRALRRRISLQGG